MSAHAPTTRSFLYVFNSALPIGSSYLRRPSRVGIQGDGKVVRESLLGHHHLAELVEVHRAGPVFVDLLDDAVQVLVR